MKPNGGEPNQELINSLIGEGTLHSSGEFSVAHITSLKERVKRLKLSPEVLLDPNNFQLVTFVAHYYMDQVKNHEKTLSDNLRGEFIDFRTRIDEVMLLLDRDACPSDYQAYIKLTTNEVQVLKHIKTGLRYADLYRELFLIELPVKQHSSWDKILESTPFKKQRKSGETDTLFATRDYFYVSRIIHEFNSEWNKTDTNHRRKEILDVLQQLPRLWELKPVVEAYGSEIDDWKRQRV